MNYAFMSFSCPKATLTDVIGLAKKHGYTGFEPRVENNHAHKIELGLTSSECQHIKTQMQDNQLELCCLALGSSFVDPATAQAQVDKTLRYLDLAEALGINRVRVFGGHIPEGLSREEGTDLLISSLLKLAPEAQAKGVSICLETHDDWCKPEQVAHVMKVVNLPAVAVNWDIMHPVRAGGSSMKAAFETLLPWVKHVHVHDGLTTLESLTMLPMGSGELDNSEAIKLLKDSQYDGFISGEWIEDTMDKAFFASHLGEELAVLKSYEQNA